MPFVCSPVCSPVFLVYSQYYITTCTDIEIGPDGILVHVVMSHETSTCSDVLDLSMNIAWWIRSFIYISFIFRGRKWCMYFFAIVVVRGRWAYSSDINSLHVCLLVPQAVSNWYYIVVKKGEYVRATDSKPEPTSTIHSFNIMRSCVIMMSTC